MQWEINVRGQPRPKGSWKAYGRGRFVLDRGERYYRIKDVGLKPQSDGLVAWTNALQWAAKSADPEPPRTRIVGPWACHCTFWFTPPKTPAHPEYVIGRAVDDCGNVVVTGDGDKLERAVWDALEGIFWANDRHIAVHSGTELYTLDRPPGATIRIQFLGDTHQLDFL